MHHLLQSLTDSLTGWCQAHTLPAYRAEQIRRWLFQQRAQDWDQMSDLPKRLRSELAREFVLWTSRIVQHTQADDGTEKLLLALTEPDPNETDPNETSQIETGQIECVLLRDRVRRTICISTQVGCAMGCVFCASGLDGVQRNLTTGEIVEQMLRLQQLLQPEERLTHIVVMGMGEPLANLDALLPALHEASSAHGLGISPRRITISTVGLPQAMRRLTNECPRYRLAVSLHAPDNKLRDQLVPVNRKIGLDRILAEADRYHAASRRQLTFEYVLLHHINDGPEHAHDLARLLRRRPVLLNVIPYNPVPGLPYRCPTSGAQSEFRRILTQAGVRVRFRHRKGHQIDAACGQLRRSVAGNVEP